MLGRAVLLITLLYSATALGSEVVDAAGRIVRVPDQIGRVLPAGPPAAILLEVLAPDLMLGWTSALPEAPRAMLSPSAATLPQIPRLTGREDITDKIQALKPDLILDYGTVSPRYAALVQATQQRTGVPTILLNGSLAEIPHVLRVLGGVLHGKVGPKRWHCWPSRFWPCRYARNILASSMPAAPTASTSQPPAPT